MAKLKKSLDRFDLVGPKLIGAVGGTADYGDSAKDKQRRINKRAKVDEVGAIQAEAAADEAPSTMARPTRKQTAQPRGVRKSHMLT